MTNEMTFGMTFKPTLPARGSDCGSTPCGTAGKNRTAFDYYGLGPSPVMQAFWKQMVNT